MRWARIRSFVSEDTGLLGLYLARSSMSNRSNCTKMCPTCSRCHLRVLSTLFCWERFVRYLHCLCCRHCSDSASEWGGVGDSELRSAWILEYLSRRPSLNNHVVACRQRIVICHISCLRRNEVSLFSIAFCGLCSNVSGRVYDALLHMLHPGESHLSLISWLNSTPLNANASLI